MKIQKEHFLNDLFEKNRISCHYEFLSYSFDKSTVIKNDCFNEKTSNPLLKTIIAFPKFLTPNFRFTKKISAHKILQHKQDCFGIIIDKSITDVQDYLKSHFSKSSSSPIIKKMKRLENCFTIQYEVFFGSIKKETYEVLMNSAYAMISNRFEQRNENNHSLNNWDKYYNCLYTLINEKKASLFVIYDDKLPIQISINFHFQKLFFAAIPAYDIDYSKFGLGNTAIYKQLEWCIQNKYDYLDMGNGDLEYKKRWCNYHYLLETHIFSSKNNMLSKFLAMVYLNHIKLKNTLKDLNIDIFFKNTIGKFGKNKEYHLEKTVLLEEIPHNSEVLNSKMLSPKVFNELPIKKNICDFLYSNQLHIGKIQVFEMVKNTFIIKGDKQAQKLTILI